MTTKGVLPARVVRLALCRLIAFVPHGAVAKKPASKRGPCDMVSRVLTNGAYWCSARICGVAAALTI